MNKAVLTLMMLLGTIQLVAAQTDEEKALITKQVQLNDRKLETFIEKGMTDSIANQFSPNCHLVTEFGSIMESRDKVKDFYLSEKKAGKKFVEYSLTATEHKVYSEVVLEVGTNTVKYSIGTDKKLYTTQYNYMLVWKQSKSGNFQIRAAMWNLPKNPCIQ
jgi:hypothetical protein